MSLNTIISAHWIIPNEANARKRRKILSHMVWLDRFEMSVILDAMDYYENEAKARLDRDPGKHANLLNVREKIALARFGKIRKTDIPAIRAGKRIPPGNRKEAAAQ